MKDDALPTNILQLIKPQQVRSYALAKGWKRMQGVNGGIALYNHPSTEWDQLLVPMEDSFDDYAKRLRDVVDTLANFERRPVSELLNDLINSDADIIRYRVASTATGRGSIPLTEGIKLLEGARRSIMAAACSAINPIRCHPRMTRTESQQLINACHLGQTERGSYSVSVACPLRAVEQDQPLLSGSEPFTRLAVATLMRSLSRIVTAIDDDNVSEILQQRSDEPVVSANLCEAVLQMQPQDEGSQLDVRVSWASTLAPPSAIPSIVRIKHEYFPFISDVAKKLRPNETPSSSEFFGYVVELDGQPGDDDQMQGEATLSVMHEEQAQLVRVDLSPEDWQTAHKAFGDHGLVRVRGTFHRGTRIHHITGISDFGQLK